MTKTRLLLPFALLVCVCPVTCEQEHLVSARAEHYQMFDSDLSK
jgi:hypothetical protein